MSKTGPVDEVSLRRLLDDVAAGTRSAEAALATLRTLPFADLGFARVDHHRELRSGLPEAVYAQGKTATECTAIVTELLEGPTSGPVLLTRVDADVAATVLATAPGGTHHERARLAVWRPAARRAGCAVVVSAGTADLAVADEAAITLDALGWTPGRVTDVGVAGMEGALASAAGGLVAAPLIAVPTSAGYGASFAGLTALLAMLASCAPGVTVVGIDNGFGAACAAARILRTREPGAREPARR